MPELTNIEATLLNDLHAQAESLENGHSGDVSVISSVVAKTAKVVVAMARTGAMSPDECKARQARCFEAIKVEINKSDWKAKLAMWVPLSGAMLGIAWKVLA